MNHSLACAYDSPTFSPLAILFNSGPCRCSPLARCLSTIAASPATVGCSNISLSPISMPNVFLILDTTYVASSECPPISKKFSSTPTVSLLSTSPHIPLTISSTAVFSSSSSFPTLTSSSLSGSHLFSTFPFLVTLISCTHITSLGTLYSGNRSLRYFFNPFVSSPLILLNTGLLHISFISSSSPSLPLLLPPSGLSLPPFHINRFISPLSSPFSISTSYPLASTSLANSSGSSPSRLACSIPSLTSFTFLPPPRLTSSLAHNSAATRPFLIPTIL